MSKIAYQKKKIQKIKAALLNRQQCYKNLLNGFSEVKNITLPGTLLILLNY
jgi:hypothetical protein